MITGAQIRSARNALRWTTEQLAKRAGVTARTIKRFEAVDDVPPSRSSTLIEVKAAFEAAGIEFIGAPTDRPGIRFAASTPQDRRRRSQSRRRV
jgi:transcriptional regulator with XRE-family HTH domain